MLSLEQRSVSSLPVSQNRTRVEILASILSVAGGGALKTHVMYRANLSHKQLEKYLTFLGENGLIREVTDPDAGTHVYQVTEKGIDFLRDYSRVSGYLTGKRL